MSNEFPSCSCLPGFTGAPPNCRSECLTNNECPSHLACINQICKDPCPGACGINAECKIFSHSPNCFCMSGYEGDPLIGCNLIPQLEQEIRNPCLPSPCGVNAECRVRNGAGSCSCLPDYIGNPYEGCRAECILNSDCPMNMACIKNKCKDPCSGSCGQNAVCQAVNHIPVCTCLDMYTGDPFKLCTIIPPRRKSIICSVMVSCDHNNLFLFSSRSCTKSLQSSSVWS